MKNKQSVLELLAENESIVMQRIKLATRSNAVDMDLLQDFYIHAHENLTVEKLLRNGEFNAGLLFVSIRNFVIDRARHDKSSNSHKYNETPIHPYTPYLESFDEGDMVRDVIARELDGRLLEELISEISEEDYKLIQLTISRKLLESVKGTFKGEKDSGAKEMRLYWKRNRRSAKVLDKMRSSFKGKVREDLSNYNEYRDLE